jgi:AcrR family transcriptional regulator
MIALQQISRRERERLARRKDILEAARAVFAEKGFDEATLDDVAVRAEFGKGTLYNYFENKEALFASVLEDSFEEAMVEVRGALAKEIPIGEKIDGFVRGMLTYFYTHLESVQLMMRESHQLRSGNPLMQLMPKLMQAVADTLAAEQRKRNIVAKLEPVALATILIGMVFSQFNSCFYRRVHATGEADTGKLTDIFGSMGTEEITREVDAATNLIHTVYFNGIGR